MKTFWKAFNKEIFSPKELLIYVLVAVLYTRLLVWFQYAV